MRVDSIIRWLMPKEDLFRGLLTQDAENLLRGARLFEQIAASTSLEDRRTKGVELKDIEHEGDRLTRRIFEALHSSFITPLDREDIRSLAMDLDDALDNLDRASRHLTLFELSESHPALCQFGEILTAMAEQIDRAIGLVWDIRQVDRIQASLVRISELENQGDDVYNSVIAELFRGDGRSPVEILKWKVVYDGLEDACDQCKDLTHILGNIVIKNA